MIHQAISPIKTEDSVLRNIPTLPPSSSQLHKVIKNLEKMVGDQREKKEAAEESLHEYRVRALAREMQFSQLIVKLKERNSTVIEDNPQINKLFKTIWDNFDEFNLKEMSLLEQKYKETMDFMDRKIKNIMIVAKQQLASNCKRSTINIENIKNDIKEVYEAASKIQEQNIEMTKLVKKLQFQVLVLREEKAMAIEDAVNRKSKVKVLQQENKILSDELLKAKLQIPIPTQTLKRRQSIRIQLQDSQKNRCESRGNQTPMIQKTLAKHKSQLYYFSSIMENHHKRRETLQYFKDNLDTMPLSTICYTPKSHKNEPTSYSSQKTSQIATRNNRTLRNSKLLERSQGFIKKPQQKQEKQQQFICTCTCKQNKQRQYQFMSTIQNLKKCLARQKQRARKLGLTVTKISTKTKQINQVLEQAFKQQKRQGGKLEELANNQKLLQTLKILKQRLTMLEKPTVNCGWGDSLVDI